MSWFSAKETPRKPEEKPSVTYRFEVVIDSAFQTYSSYTVKFSTDDKQALENERSRIQKEIDGTLRSESNLLVIGNSTFFIDKLLCVKVTDIYETEESR